MFNNTETVLIILNQIYDALKTVQTRFEPVDKVDYFTDSPDGKEKVDGI